LALFDLTIEEGRYLVQLARKTVTAFLGSGRMPPIPSDAPARLSERCGVFVTLNSVKDGHDLRGCIGFPTPEYPLVEATMRSAIEAATGDPRFNPVTLREFQSEIVVEVSVLTPPELVKVSDPRAYPNEIKVGRDGLIVERGAYRGLLLPQVPIEWGWDEEEFLSQCCLKAGLSPDAWLVKGTRILKFQAIIFQEERPGGEIRRRSLGDVR
jgi:uncharacterized protein (TIGR00296 family)